MLKNYITIAINNLLKNKLYSTINIAGLAIGLAACIVIALYVRGQYSYDKHWENSDRIYRVNFSYLRPGLEPLRFASAPLPALPQLHQYFQNEIEQSARAFSQIMMIDAGDSQFKDNLVQIDPELINMFQFKVLSGSLENTLTNPANIALSADAAARYFGTQDPIGKVLTVTVGDVSSDYKVTATYSIPANTVLDIPLLSLLDETSKPPSLKSWFSMNTTSFLKLKDGVDIETLKSLTPAFIDQHIDISLIASGPDLSASDAMAIDLQNIETLHLESPWDTTRAGGNKTVVISFAVISLLVLLIGCINFTILTTAKATQRAREIAMRKVVGAKRIHLILQFLGESTFIVLLAMILSLGIVELMLPLFESIVGETLSMDYTSPFAFLSLLSLLVIVGISGGLYPACILSNFQPGNILKANRSTETKGSISLRSMLVIFQFCVSIILIIATGVIYTQMRHSLNLDPGYNKDNLLIINQIISRPELKDRIVPLKNELLNLSNITDVGFSDIQPSEQRPDAAIYTHLGKKDSNYTIAFSAVGYDYFTTYQIPFIAGRAYHLDRDTPASVPNMRTSTIGGNASRKLTKDKIIINESAAKELGYADAEDALGEIINSTTFSNTNYTIIGVVADNHLFSINAPPRSEVYLLGPDKTDVITVRFKGSPKKILEQVESVWMKVMGSVEISTIFVDNLLADEFQQEQTEEKTLISFSLLAVAIACMGLFGSAAFTVERQTKEIGLRKVMGAKVKDIVAFLLWKFSKPVFIANIVAWPVAIFAMQLWLERFAYRFNPLLMIPICLVSGFIALLIAWLTVASNTTRAARRSPIHSLRYE